MAFIDLYSELTGWVPKLDVDLAKKLVNRAYYEVRRKNLWSFQLFDANWLSPAIENSGTVTTVRGATTVVFDSTASTAIAALYALTTFPTPLLQRQFRVGAASTIYNIWGYSVSLGIVTLTLDRPYVEASGSAQAYSIYQCYYPAPYADFLTWISVVDMTNYNDLRTTTTRDMLNLRDPQRSIFYLPTDVAYYQTDKNTASATYKYPLFELWGQPTYVLPYQLYGIRRGVDLSADTDTLPAAIGDDCILEGAKMYAYEWAEANKGDMPRAAGADFKFLMGKCAARFTDLTRQYRREDRETCDNWYNVRRRPSWLPNADGYFNAIANTANPGAPW